MAERSKAPVSGTGLFGGVGSNPTPINFSLVHCVFLVNQDFFLLSLCSCGLVGYDARFTRERSPVRSWAAVNFCFCTHCGCGFFFFFLHTVLFSCSEHWSSGMILASGARGRGFNSPMLPFCEGPRFLFFIFVLTCVGKKIKNRVTHDGTRTHNLALRRGTPYPFGHAGAI